MAVGPYCNSASGLLSDEVFVFIFGTLLEMDNSNTDSQ